MSTICVTHVDDDRFAIGVRQHSLYVDQPRADGGTDTAPTPTELFVAAFAGCVAFYARRYLVRHDLPDHGLTVTATYTMGFRPPRVADIDLRLSLPDGVPAERRDALLAVASHCTLHNTLLDPPRISIAIGESARAVA